MNENANSGNANEPETAGLTELVFIIDRSGSMHGLEADTIGGFNSVLEANRSKEGECVVSTVLFDHETKVLHDRESLAQVKNLTDRDYEVRGCTALLDALGRSIHHTERVQKYLPQGWKAQKVIFVIITDGMENASKKYRLEQVKRMIEEKQEQGWEFMFLGANMDAVSEAGRLGICEDRAVTYVADAAGTRATYNAVAEATCSMRASQSRIGRAWKRGVEADTASRG